MNFAFIAFILFALVIFLASAIRILHASPAPAS